MLFDTHTHITDKVYASDREDVIMRMFESGVGLCMAISSSMETSRRVMAFCKETKHPIYGAVAVHPHHASEVIERDYAELEAAFSIPKIIAWGEMGLDYHYDYSPRPKQIEVFERQLDRAIELKKPVIIHVREAHGETIEILRKRHAAKEARGIIHCFSGSVESAQIYLNMGYHISIAGPVTFKNANSLVEVAKYIPIDRLLVETDCPYLSPVPMRGKRNEPAYVEHVARRIAELRNMDFEEFANATTENAKALFGISSVFMVNDT